MINEAKENKSDVKFLVKTYYVGLEKTFRNLLRTVKSSQRSLPSREQSLESILVAYPVTHVHTRTKSDRLKAQTTGLSEKPGRKIYQPLPSGSGYQTQILPEVESSEGIPT